MFIFTCPQPARQCDTGPPAPGEACSGNLLDPPGSALAGRNLGSCRPPLVARLLLLVALSDTFRVAGSCFGFFALVVGLIGPPPTAMVAGDLVGKADFAVLTSCQVGLVSGVDGGAGLRLLLQALVKFDKGQVGAWFQV